MNENDDYAQLKTEHFSCAFCVNVQYIHGLEIEEESAEEAQLR